MKFFLYKKSRHSWAPYDGPACTAAGVESNKWYTNIQDAQKDLEKLNEINPVGFKIGYNFDDHSLEELTIIGVWAIILGNYKEKEIEDGLTRARKLKGPNQ